MSSAISVAVTFGVAGDDGEPVSSFNIRGELKRKSIKRTSSSCARMSRFFWFRRGERNFCHSPSFLTLPAVPSALLALGFASGSHDEPRAGPEK
jgi:hypothetical protein